MEGTTCPAAKARTSILGNGENDCITCYSRIGFGMMGLTVTLTLVETKQQHQHILKSWGTCWFSERRHWKHKPSNWSLILASLHRQRIETLIFVVKSLMD